MFGKDLSILIAKYDVVIEGCNLFAAKYGFFLNNSSVVTGSKDNVVEDAHQLAYNLLNLVLTWLNRRLPGQITYSGTTLQFTHELEVKHLMVATNAC